MLMKVLLIVTFCVLPMALPGQTSSGEPTLPAGFVDGKIHPELIPDYACYRLVLIHLVAVGSASVSKQTATYNSIGLSAADTLILQNQVLSFGASYAQWQAQSGLVPSATAEQNVHAMVLSARDSIITNLSPAGASEFVQYVQLEKAHMIVRP
jgi:hypothetical protein